MAWARSHLMLNLLTKMINEKSAKSYCKDDISLIENYDKAIADDTQTWHCHHRRETIFSRKDLMEIGEYYNRPACELIFLTSPEHNRVHTLGKCLSAETRKKISEANKGKCRSVETRKKISEAKKNMSDETKRKISAALLGNTAVSGTYWYNNGKINTRSKKCPEGFVKGRIKK